MSTPDLSERMRSRADVDQLPADHMLRTLADALDEAVTGFYGTPQSVSVRRLVGAWARARMVWCAHTGESLL
ncbi:hypothetical protein [Variovorax boronicumulans]|uniref:hypothetical protein n=1 Tax=Variovorax boronicumulans TaxID=436515 RepID=UPI0012E546E5|nr:hypothetical protein [Variovorax boronicumulans]GER16693.1 hypothetical protein VCH24_16990 [Variovorax boronicumulans]